jgi:hypothetical protein
MLNWEFVKQSNPDIRVERLELESGYVLSIGTLSTQYPGKVSNYSTMFVPHKEKKQEVKVAKATKAKGKGKAPGYNPNPDWLPDIDAADIPI